MTAVVQTRSYRLGGVTCLIRDSSYVYTLSPDRKHLTKLSLATGELVAVEHTLPSIPRTMVRNGTTLYVLCDQHLIAVDTTSFNRLWTAAGTYEGGIASIGSYVFVGIGGAGMQVWSTSGVFQFFGQIPLTRVQGIIAADATPTLIVLDGNENAAVVQYTAGTLVVLNTLRAPQVADIRAVRVTGTSANIVVSDRQGNGALIVCNIAVPTVPVFAAPDRTWSTYVLQTFQEGVPATTDDASQFAVPWWFAAGDALSDVIAWPGPGIITFILPTPPPSSHMLIETGFALLLEDGSYLLLEP